MRRFIDYKKWFVLVVLAIMSAAAFIGGPMSVLGSGKASVSADCLFREQAGDKVLAIDWLAGDISPTVETELFTSTTPIDFVGRIKCGANAERIVEWVWKAGETAPWIDAYEIAP